jgi:hypothetical protein
MAGEHCIRPTKVEDHEKINSHRNKKGAGQHSKISIKEIRQPNRVTAVGLSISLQKNWIAWLFEAKKKYGLSESVSICNHLLEN